MENRVIQAHLREHDDLQTRRISTRLAAQGEKPAGFKCLCCRDEQVQSSSFSRPQHSAAAAPAAAGNHPQKRKRSSVPRPPPSAEPSQHSVAAAPAAAGNHPQKRKRSSVPRPPPSDTPAVDLCSPTIPDEDLPLALPVPSSHLPCMSTAKNSNSPLTIHNHSVDEYQQIYHEVVDHLLRNPRNGRDFPYSLGLGIQIKQRLWERMGRPSFTESVDENGKVTVHVSYGGGGIYPPMIPVDTTGEPKPKQPPKKRAKKTR